MGGGGASMISLRPVWALGAAARRRRALPSRCGKRRQRSARVTLYLSGFGAGAATPAQRNGAAGRGGRWLGPGGVAGPPAPFPGGLPLQRRGSIRRRAAMAELEIAQRSSSQQHEAVAHWVFKLTCMVPAVLAFRLALKERPKPRAPAYGQNASLYSLQLISGASGSSGRRSGQIKFFSAGILTDTCPSHCPSCDDASARSLQGLQKQHHAPRKYGPLGGDASESARLLIQAPRARAFKSTRSRHGPAAAESTRGHKKSIEAKKPDETPSTPKPPTSPASKRTRAP